jgi:hypothetical protein
VDRNLPLRLKGRCIPCSHTMSGRITTLYYVLWFAHPVFQLSIAALMLHRGQHRKFKYFFGYVITQLVSFAAVFSSFSYHRGGAAFLYIYWFCEAGTAAFGFGVIYEVFVDVFRSFDTLRDLGTVLFKWAGLVMLLVAGVVSISTNSNLMPPWMQAITTTQRCVRIIQVGMILFLLFFARYLGVSRRQQSFGIALGFGGFAMVELTLLASWIGNHLANPWMSIVNMTAYNGSLILWFSYLALKSPARDASSTLLQTQRWEHSLSDIQHQPLPANSLIPMFEGMVDRALSRTQAEMHSAPAESSVTNAGETAASSGTFQRAAVVRAGSRS